jgi:signal transduction histidine kinase/CheY-like chemotaxis protein
MHRTYLVAFVLIVIGVLLNSFITIPLYANLTLHLGAIVSVLAVYMLGARWAVIISIIVNLPLGITLDNWFIPFLLLTEIMFVSFLVVKRWSLIYADMLYWFILGMPLTFVAFNLLSPSAMDFAVSAVLKQAINGLLYVSLASIILPIIPSSLKQAVQSSKLQKMRLIIRTRLVTAIVGTSILVGIVSAELSVRNQEAALNQALIWKVKQAAIYTQNYLDGYKKKISFLADSYSNIAMSEGVFHNTIGLTLKENSGFLSMLVTNSIGNVIYAAPESFNKMLNASNKKMSVSDRDYFIQAKETGELFTSQVFVGRGFGNDLIVAISKSFSKSGDNEFNGVVEGSLNLSVLQNLENKISLDEESSIVLLDANKRVIYSSKNTGLDIFEHFELKKTEEAYKTAIPLGVFESNNEKNERFFKKFTLENGWEVVILQRPATLIRAFESSYMFIIAIALIFAFLANYIARYIANFIAKPIEDISTFYTSGESNFGDFSIPLAENSYESFQLKKSLQEYRELQNLFQQNLEEKVRQQTKQLSEANEKMLKAKLAAQQSDRLKSEFLANMSHEIRTPMNGIIGMLHLLKSSKLEQQQLHRLNLAKNSADALLVVINDILDLSKIEAGKMELEHVEFNILELLSECIEPLAIAAQDKGVEFTLDMSGVKFEVVKGDPVRLKQVIINLIGNAIKFTERGQISLIVKLDSNDHLGYRLICKVQDTGIGISAEKIKTLFDAFSQADSSTTRKYGGTGLGLSIAKQICELMLGSLTVSSEEGVGSCFEFEVQLYSPSKVCPRDVRPWYKSRTFLVFDIGSENASILANLLDMWGASTIYCSEKQEKASVYCTGEIERIGVPDAVIFDTRIEGLARDVLSSIDIGDTPQFEVIALGEQLNIENESERSSLVSQLTRPLVPARVFNSLTSVVEPLQRFESNHSLSVNDEAMALKSSRSVGSDNDVAHVDETSWKGRGHVLIVEDNLVNQAVLEGILEEFDVTCDIVENGKEALQQLCTASQPYQVVFMDCQMPVLDGYQTTQAIRNGQAGKVNKRTTIIAMTANAMEGDREKCLESGMDDYLTKPVDGEQIYQALLRWMPK